MSQPPISDDIALRIALAARVLPDMDAARMIQVIEDAIGLPPTPERLGELRVKDLRKALGGALAGMEADALNGAHDVRNDRRVLSHREWIHRPKHQHHRLQ